MLGYINQTTSVQLTVAIWRIQPHHISSSHSRYLASTTAPHQFISPSPSGENNRTTSVQLTVAIWRVQRFRLPTSTARRLIYTIVYSDYDANGSSSEGSGEGTPIQNPAPSGANLTVSKLCTVKQRAVIKVCFTFQYLRKASSCVPIPPRMFPVFMCFISHHTTIRTYVPYTLATYVYLFFNLFLSLSSSSF